MQVHFEARGTKVSIFTAMRLLCERAELNDLVGRDRDQWFSSFVSSVNLMKDIARSEDFFTSEHDSSTIYRWNQTMLAVFGTDETDALHMVENETIDG